MMYIEVDGTAEAVKDAAEICDSCRRELCPAMELVLRLKKNIPMKDCGLYEEILP